MQKNPVFVLCVEANILLLKYHSKASLKASFSLSWINVNPSLYKLFNLRSPFINHSLVINSKLNLSLWAGVLFWVYRGLSWVLREHRCLKKTKIDQIWKCFCHAHSQALCAGLKLPAKCDFRRGLEEMSNSVLSFVHFFLQGKSGCFCMGRESFINETENWLHLHELTIIQMGSSCWSQILKAFS